MSKLKEPTAEDLNKSEQMVQSYVEALESVYPAIFNQTITHAKIAEELRDHLLEMAFNKIKVNKWIECLFPNASYYQVMCRKKIVRTPDDNPTYSYRCLDCQQDDMSLVCEDCFEYSEHRTHRYACLTQRHQTRLRRRRLRLRRLVLVEKGRKLFEAQR